MKKLLAVSGGIDSIVLLHIFSHDPDVLVAHFNHGTRSSARDDQRFVSALAKKYHKPFYTTTATLGPNASEFTARTARYHYLRQLATQLNARIYTAHHTDDLLETIIINYLRGTGWRGLAPLDAPDIVRPFLHPDLLPKSNQPNFTRPLSKTDLIRYAAQYQLAFRQDPTNQEEHYLRNRIRILMQNFSLSQKDALLSLTSSQYQLKSQIEQLLASLLPTDHLYRRSWFINLPDSVALEILRAALASINLSATRPQLQNFLHAIRTYAPEKSFNLPGNHLIILHRNFFRL